MEYDVEIVTASPKNVAVRRFEATEESIGELMGASFGAVAADLARRGIPITGPAVAVFDPRDGGFSVAAGFEVGTSVVADGVVEPLRLQAGEVATTTHVGPYSGLGDAYSAIREDVSRHGRVLEEHQMWEEYLDGPDVPPERTRTVVCWPLVPA